MDIDVVGRHALLFDDDALAGFVNSNDALVEWHSLLIDRYDVRHLLSTPPPSRRRRNPHQHAHSPDSFESDLDYERYLDLPSDEQEPDDGGKPVVAGGYNAFPFSYGNTDDSNDQKNSESELGTPGFRPPFHVPENLLIPPTEKLHQIIARTAMFVSKHGGQSEIILRVKQGDNPSFGFLMPDHHLHSYFRFLVDHGELLHSDVVGKPQNEEKISDTDLGGGALSLLGSLYGSAEDEDAAAELALTSKENVSGETVDASATVSHVSEKTVPPKNISVKDEAVSKHLLTSKEKAHAVRRNSFISGLKAGSGSSTRKGESSGSLSAATEKLRASAMPVLSKIEPLIIEPPSEIKRLVDKIVEFIMKNGKQFEAVLIEQDSEYGRFPFLLPSNQYHPYYLKVLQKDQESKVSGKNSFNEKDGLVGHGPDKKTSVSKESGSFSLESAGCDIPYDSDRKEKFKMVIGKSKKDGQDPPPKATQQQFGVSVDAAAVAAILQAATKGIRNPNLGFLSRSSLNGNSHDHSSEGGQASSLGSLHSCQPRSVIQKSDQKYGEHGLSVPVAKAIAKTAAIEAASEADSCEAHLTREQKLKAERLRRAKMFVAMIKSGAAPLKPEPSRCLSVEPQESGVFGAGAGAEVNFAAKEREGSSAPLEIGTSDKNETSTKKHSTDEFNERRARRKYRSKSSKHEEAEAEEEEDDEVVHRHSRKKHRSRRSSLEDDNKEGRDEEERDNKHSRKKHRLHHSSHVGVEQDDDDDDESDHKYSRKKHQSLREEEDKENEEERDHRRSRKKHRSHRSSHHSRDGHKHKKRHSSSKDRESRHRHKHDIFSDEEHLRHSRSDKHRKGSQSEREELEEGEISSKASDQSGGSVGGGASREASVDLSSSYQDRRALPQPSETTEVSDDLRAKIRAILMGTL